MSDENELREAAERCLNGGDITFESVRDYWKSPQHARDNDAIAEFVRDELSRRDAEAAERAKPVDEKFWRSLHVTEYFAFTVKNIPYFLSSFGYDLPDGFTRGQLLDLLAALKGGGV